MIMKSAHFLNGKIITNKYLAFGIFLGLFLEKYLIGSGGRHEGILLYFIKHAFS